MADLNALDIKGLSHRYGETSTLHAIDFSVRSGEFVALLGASGCGKTTLLKAVAGLVQVQQGSITIDGTAVVTEGAELIPCEDRGVGFVFQEYALFPHMTVAENVGYGIDSGNDARVNGLLELVGLGELSHRLPSKLSGGQQQRVALARALAPRPALLLLDEPFANVDAALRESLGRLLRRVVQDQGAAVLMVTHDQQSALSLADRVVVLEPTDAGGAIIQDDIPATVYRRPTSKTAAGLTGPCVFLAADAQGQTATSHLGELQLINAAQGSIEVMVRPEQIRFSHDSSGSVVVVDVMFSGSSHKIICQTPTGITEATSEGGEAPPSKGSTGSLSITGPVWALQSD